MDYNDRIVLDTLCHMATVILNTETKDKTLLIKELTRMYKLLNNYEFKEV